MIKIKGAKIPASLKETRNFDKELGVTLPQDYVKFLLTYNGGHPIQDTYQLKEPIALGDDEADIAWFFSLYDGNVCNIKNEVKYSQERIPYELIPIAYGSGGDRICLAVKGENYGKVYFCDIHNEAPEGQAPWWDNIYLIANNFTEFLDGLYEFDIDDEGNEIRRYQDGRVEITPTKK